MEWHTLDVQNLELMKTIVMGVINLWKIGKCFFSKREYDWKNVDKDGKEASSRGPVAQLGQSIGLLIRGSRVQVLPGPPSPIS